MRCWSCNRMGGCASRLQVPVRADLLAEARQYRDDVERLLRGAAALEAFPANLCPLCSGGLWVRQSELSGGPGPWRCAGCNPLPADIWTNATAKVFLLLSHQPPVAL